MGMAKRHNAKFVTDALRLRQGEHSALQRAPRTWKTTCTWPEDAARGMSAQDETGGNDI